MKRTALYMRVSTDRQANEGDSIPAQREALRKYVGERPDLVIADEYCDDGISGTKYSQRDELQRLLDDVRAGKIDLILFTRLDRWFRSVRHYTATQEILDKYNVPWTAIWEPIFDTTTPSGKLIINQMMSIAQFEAENTAVRINHVFSYKVTQGEVLSGKQPVGYKIHNKKLVIDDPNAEIVRDLFNHFAENGNLNELNRYAKERYGWNKQKHIIKKMLLNEKYIGRFRWNENYCPAIIDKAVFEDVSRKLTMTIRNSQKHTYIFSGLLRCGECGRRLAGNRQKNVRSKNYAKLYRCPTHFNEKGNCPNSKAFNEHTLENRLLNSIPELAKNIIESSEVQEVKQKDNSAKIATVYKKIKKLKELYVNDLIDMDEYKEDRENLLTELAKLEEEKRENEEKPNAEYINLLVGMNLREFYESLDDERNKRIFWRSFLKEVRLWNNHDIKVYFL